MKLNIKKLAGPVLAVLFALMWMRSCSSNSSNEMRVRDQAVVIDSLKNQIVEATELKEADLAEIQLLFRIEALKSERRSVLNINQIFLTKKRPDARVIEIDKEIEKLEEQLKAVQ